jgi:hypothetical protein
MEQFAVLEKLGSGSFGEAALRSCRFLIRSSRHCEESPRHCYWEAGEATFQLLAAFEASARRVCQFPPCRGARIRLFLLTGLLQVAIKTMSREFATWEEVLQLREIQCLLRLKHPNVVALLRVRRL